MSYKKIKMDIDDGDTKLGTAIIYRKGKSVCAISISTEHNYVKIQACGSESDGSPMLLLQHVLDSGNFSSVPTTVTFPEFKGWNVWSWNDGKGDIALCLVKLYP